MTSRSGLTRFARDAADIPAATPPMTTRRRRRFPLPSNALLTTTSTFHPRPGTSSHSPFHDRRRMFLYAARLPFLRRADRRIPSRSESHDPHDKAEQDEDGKGDVPRPGQIIHESESDRSQGGQQVSDRLGHA